MLQRVEGFLPCNKIPCEFRDFMPPKKRCFAPEGFYMFLLCSKHILTIMRI